IAVVGSLNVDFVTRTPRLPAPGETLTASSFETGFGGKGANQAVACSRLADKNVKVSMVGNVGDDSFGADYFAALKEEGIDASKIRMLEGEKTGIANIIVEEDTGENRILLATNANYAFSHDPSAEWDLVPSEADIVIMQLEIPLNVVLHNIKKASASGKHVLLNPAPAVPLPNHIFSDIDTLVLNETESVIVAGKEAAGKSPEQLARSFLAKGVKDAVIITLGGDGLAFATASGTEARLPARKVKVVDTTAAGDTFVGGYAVQLGKQIGAQFDHRQALRFATLAASRTVEKKGAMSAIPTLEELD
ncbi:hypothetical protein BAUCODRAFT_59158, partial [Baudoinia panamericana UAMH 10762]